MKQKFTAMRLKPKLKATTICIMLLSLVFVLGANRQTQIDFSWDTNPLETGFTQIVDGQAIALETIADAQAAEKGETLVLEYTVPAHECDQVLLFYTKDIETWVYLDDVLVYAFEMEEDFAFLQTPGNVWNEIGIPAAQSETRLRLVLTSNFDNRYQSTLSHLYLLHGSEVLWAVLHPDAFRIVMAVILFFMTLVSYVNAYLWKRHTTRRYFIALANLYLCTTLWLASMCGIMNYLSQRAVFSYLLSMLMANVVSVAFYEFFATVYAKRTKWLLFLGYLVWGNLLLQLALQFIWDISMLDLLPLLYFVFAFGGIVAIGLVVHHIITHKKASDFSLVSLAIVLCGAVLEIVVLCLFPARTDLIGVCGVLGLLVYLNVNQVYLTIQESKLDLQKLALEENYNKLQNTTLMKQIKAHFFFNTLNTISALCKYNPAQADTATTAFAQYMRSYMRLINEAENIPLEKELEIVEASLTIETLRFPDSFTYETDLAFTDFKLPPLCIQAIVENSMVHGLRQIGKDGMIRIETKKVGNNAQVRITDNGVGFDPNILQTSESIGLKNLTSRMKHMANGEVRIHSAPGQGTETIITIPLSGEGE